MKPKFSILIKLCLIISVLIYMPIKEAMSSFFNKTKLQWIQYQWDDDFLHTQFKGNEAHIDGTIFKVSKTYL